MIDLFNLFLHDCLIRAQCLNVMSSRPKATVLNDNPNNADARKNVVVFFKQNKCLNMTKDSFRVLVADRS